MKRAASAAAAALLAFGAPAAGAPAAPEPIVVFGAAAGGDTQTLPALERLRAQGVDPAAFEGRVRVVPVREKRPMAQVWPLELGAAAAPSGWRWAGAVASHSRTGADPASVLDIPMATRAAPTAIPFRLGDYQELWLDYASVRGLPTCHPSIRLELLLGEPAARRIAWAGAGDAPLAAQVALDPAPAGWAPKGPGYLLRRWLGSAPVSAWFFSQDGARALLQRRLDESLHGIDQLELAVNPGVAVHHVNLRVRRRDGAEEILQFPQLESRMAAGKAEATLRLPLREVLEQREPGHGARDLVDGRTDAFRLVEISVFVPGDANALVAQGALRRAALLAPARPGAEPSAVAFRLPARTVSDAFGRHRAVVDLRSLARAGEVALGDAKVRLAGHHAPDASACAIELLGARAANPYPGEVPLFASRLESITNDWSGASFEPATDASTVQVPGILARFDFTMLASSRESMAASRYVLDVADPGKARLDALPPPPPAVFARKIDGSALASAEAIAPDAGRLRASGPSPRASASGKGLILEGGSTDLEMAWPWNGRVGPRTLFLLSAGTQEPLGDAHLEIDTSQGMRRLRVVANEPLVISDRELEVRAVRLRLRPHRSPFRVELREMVLFEPTTTSITSAFEEPVLLHRGVASVPFEKQPPWVLEAAPGRVTGVLPGDDASAAAFELDPVVEHARGIRLRYRLPQTLGACPLAMRLVGRSGALERRLCLPAPQGEAYVPIATLLESVAEAHAIKDLRALELRIAADDAPLRRRVDTFTLEFELDGWTRLSPAQESLEHPVLAISNAKSGAGLPVLREAIASGAAWRMLEPDEVARLLSEGKIEPVPHPLFAVDRVELLPRGDAAAAKPGPRPAHAAPAGSPKLGKYLALGALLAALGVGWWLGGSASASRWWWPRWSTLTERLQRVEHGLVERCSRWLPTVLAVAGLIASAVALWTAGRPGNAPADWVLLAFAGSMAVGAWMHWRPESSLRWRRAALRAILAIAAAATVWGAGRSGFTGALAGMLILAAWVYAILPSRSGLLRFFLERGIHAAAWAGLSLVSFVIGQIFYPGWNGSLPAILAAFFAAAALATVVRAGLDLADGLPERYRSALYRGPGAAFFGAAGLALVLAAVMVVAGMEAMAERSSVIGYCAAFLGIVAQVGRGRRQQPETT